MKVSPQFKMNLGKVAVITVCYILINLFLALYDDALLNSPFSAGPSELFDFKFLLLISTLIGLIAGTLGGTMLVVINGSLFRRKSFRYAMLTTGGGYTLIFVIIVIIITTINVRAHLGNEAVFSEALNYGIGLVLNTTMITYFILWGAITMFTLFLLQVNDKFGPGILRKFLKGQYHHPKKEHRIFMFLDMRSSTTITEKIGDEKYFDLLNEMISDITGVILNNGGEIYQYVGDEIVISWPKNKGIRTGNFLKCFIQIQKRLKDLAPTYQKKYGVVPEFKAGLHYGQVMAGEIGVIKKDIVYSGDVLNTTARIQGKCNEFGVDLLMSTETFNLISNTEAYEMVPLGNIELRGKERKIDLNTVRIN